MRSWVAKNRQSAICCQSRSRLFRACSPDLRFGIASVRSVGSWSLRRILARSGRSCSSAPEHQSKTTTRGGAHKTRAPTGNRRSEGADDVAFSLDNHEPKKIRGAQLGVETTKHQRSHAQERRVAREGGGHRQSGSGARPGASRKADVTGVEDYLIECKRTDGAGLYLAKTTFEKIEREAAAVGKAPAIQVDIDGRKTGRKRWIIIPEDEFYDLIR